MTTIQQQHESTQRFGAPVVAWAGSTAPDSPLVVLLHGRGADERSILGLAELLPTGPAYAAVRAPINEGGGYAWFANRGIGRPTTESLAETMSWFRNWLDEVAPAGRPVVLVGFSGGAAFAGGLILADPRRYSGAAVLYGTLPFDAGVPLTPGRLSGLTVLLAHGDNDRVIPRELLDRTWSYLLGDSGAAVLAHRDGAGHGLTTAAVRLLAGWLGERLTFVRARGEQTALSSAETVPFWPTLPSGVLPARTGTRPEVTWTIPQSQQSDLSPRSLQEALHERIVALAGVHSRQSAISVPGARGYQLESDRRFDADAADAFLVPPAGEFAHLHPVDDGSLHLALPSSLATDVVVKGWGQTHPLAGVRLTPRMAMVYGPRTPDELEIVAAIVETSHTFATGTGSAPQR